MKRYRIGLFLTAFFFGVVKGYSQLSAGLNVGTPTGDWRSGYGMGLGADVRYEAPFRGRLNWTASAGFLTFVGKSTIVFKYNNISAMQVVGGAKYYFDEKKEGLYSAADLGLYILSSTFSNTGGNARVGFTPAVGYKMDNFDFSLRYTAASDFSFLAIRAAYIIGPVAGQQ